MYEKIFESFQSNPYDLEVKSKPVCAVTGEPAKYYDKLTKKFYCNVESFKIIRERYFQKEEDALLFKIQTLSDLASQKKEKLKKLILSNGSNTTKSMISLVNKYGILKNDPMEFEKKIISRIYLFILLFR